MAKFNKLDVPHQWKDEFTKYPHGYTIFEALCKWVKQVDNMVDNINNWNDYLDNFVTNFEFELQEEVQSIITRWQEEGLLDDIIGSVLNTELDNVKTQLVQTQTQLEGLEVNVITVGVYPNDGIDHTSELRQLLSTGVIPVFPSGRYIISDELLFKHGQGIRTVGKVTFDGTNFIGANGKSVIRVTNNGNDYTPLPSLASELNKGSNVITFSSSHGLKEGDIISIYNPTDFSWASNRAYLRKGEYVRVAVVSSSTQVLLENNLFDDYPLGTVNLYKMNMGEFSITGDIEIIQGKQGDYTALNISRVRDCDFSKVKTVAKNGASISTIIDQCFNVNLNISAVQSGESGTSTDYGLAISNSQHITYSGYFSASRHGVSHGGSGGITRVPTRDVQGYGKVFSTGEGLVPAFDTHSNCEFISFDGVIYGGANLSGASNTLKGTVFPDVNGVAITFSHLKSYSQDISGVKIVSNKSLATPDGVIMVKSELDNVRGGLLNAKNMEVYAPLSRLGFFIRFENNLATNEPIDVDLRGSMIVLGGVDRIGYRIEFGATNKTIRNLKLDDVTLICDRNIVSDITKVENPQLQKQTGEASFSTTTDSATKTVTVTFPKPYPTNYKPFIKLSISRGAIGGYVDSRAINITNTGFTFLIYTINGSNFSTAITDTFKWSAE